MANVVLFFWPIVVIVLFTRKVPAVALIWALLGGYLLLPAGIEIDLPGVPALHRNNIPAIACLIMALFVAKRSAETPLQFQLPGWLPKSALSRICLLLLLVGSVGTVLTNREPIPVVQRFLPGISLYDGISLLGATILSMIPFILGRKFFAHSEQQKYLLWAICAAAGFYAIPALYEVRMSPQLHSMVYGYFPHSFLQHYRGAGIWRPVVFLEHGLNLGLFMAMAIIGALVLLKAAVAEQRLRYIGLTAWLFLTLLLSTNLGALLLTLVCGGVVFFFGRRTQLLFATAITCIILTYPMARSTAIVPLDTVVRVAEWIDTTRAASLQYRLRNEEVFLQKAAQKPLLGWGPWGRNHAYDPYGNVATVADGYWIGPITVGGWARYIAEFGLLSIGILTLYLRRRRLELDSINVGLCMVLVLNLVDLIPNSGLSPITWLCAGALLGRSEITSKTAVTTETQSHSEPPRVQYSRFPTTSFVRAPQASSQSAPFHARSS